MASSPPADDLFAPGHASDDLFAEGHAAEAPGVGESLLRGAAQGASLGFADELTGGGEALLDKLVGSHASLVDLYRQHRDESRAKYKAAEEANPTAYGAGELGGGLATALVPGLGEGGIAIQAAKMAGLGAVAGAGRSEAEDARGLIGDAAVSGLVGGAAGAGGALAGKALGALGNKLAPGLQDSADAATARSVGLSRAEIAAQKASGELGDTVGNLRDEGVATAFTTPGKAAERIQTRIDEINAGRVGVLKDLDKAVAERGPVSVEMPGQAPYQLEGSGITGNSMADRLDIEAAKLGANPNRTSAQEGFLDKAAGKYRELGDAPISFDQADQYIRGFGEGAGPGVGDVRNSAAKALREQMFERANTEVPGVGDELRAAGQRVSRLRNVADSVNPAERDVQIPHSLTGLAFQVAKTYGNSVKGSLFDRLAAVARTNPAALGKWGGYLAAAAQRGPAALASTHFALSQTDPSYAAQARAALDGGHE